MNADLPKTLISAEAPLLTTGQCATLACLLECMAPKPGNVHRSADFEDLTLYDFAASAVAIAPAMDAAAQNGAVGNAVLQAVTSTKRLVGSNSNLGMILLLAPLAAAARHTCLRDGVCQVLRQLGPQDATDVYAAIRLAEPSGLGEVDDMDIGGVPPDDLRAAMRAAAARDLIARQYAEDFVDVFDFVAPAIVAGQRQGWTLIESIVYTHVQTMNAFPDSLIARKCGIPTALESAARAGAVLDSGRPGDAAYWEALDDLDFWLRCDGHRRNPGTTADMISAGVFVGLRDGTLTPPYR